MRLYFVSFSDHEWSVPSRRGTVTSVPLGDALLPEGSDYGRLSTDNAANSNPLVWVNYSVEQVGSRMVLDAWRVTWPFVGLTSLLQLYGADTCHFDVELDIF